MLERVNGRFASRRALEGIVAKPGTSLGHESNNELDAALPAADTPGYKELLVGNRRCHRGLRPRSVLPKAMARQTDDQKT